MALMSQMFVTMNICRMDFILSNVPGDIKGEKVEFPRKGFQNAVQEYSFHWI